MYVNRYLSRFVLAQNIVLSTCVLDAAAEITNVAPFGVASQSTTAFGGAASRANDGDTNGAFFGGSVTHTAEGGVDPEPFWELAFPADFAFESITLWNRTDCCGGRLSDLTISIFDDDVEVYNSFATLGDFINPFNELGGPESIELDLAGTVGATSGDRVRVARVGQTLSLAEVQTYADTLLEPFPVLEIGRQTGAATLRNNTIAFIDLAGYSIRSSKGNLDPTNWLSIAENYDSDSDGSVDADDPWLEFTDPSSTRDISEGTLGTATLEREAAAIQLGSGDRRA